MDEEIAGLAAQAVPFMSAAAERYGGAALAGIPPDSSGEPADLGRRLLIRVFGTWADGQSPPAPVAALLNDPGGIAPRTAAEQAVRQALAASATAAADVRSLLAGAPDVTQLTHAGRDNYTAGRDMVTHNNAEVINNNYNYYPDGSRPSGAWPRNLSDALQGLGSVLCLVAAVLTLRWVFFWASSVVALVIAGVAVLVDHRHGRSWHDRSTVASIGVCVIACAVLASTLVVRLIGPAPGGTHPQAPNAASVNGQAPLSPGTATSSNSSTSAGPGASGGASKDPVLIESVTPLSTGVESTRASASKVPLTAQQLAQWNADYTSGGMDSAASVRFMASIHAIAVGNADTKVTVMGNDSKTVTINGIQVIKHCEAPLTGTLFENESQGVNGTISLGFDLDSQIDYAQNAHYGYSGNYFQDHDVTLAPGEVQTFDIQLLTKLHYCQFSFMMTVATPSGTITENINNNGKPFEMTASEADTTGSLAYHKYSCVYIGGIEASLTPALHDPKGTYVEIDPQTGLLK